MEISTTLTGVELKTGSSGRGPWTLYLFEAPGFKCQTFDDGLGRTAQGLLQRPARIVYDVEQRGEHSNNVIKSIEAADGATATQTQSSTQSSAEQSQQTAAQSAGLSAKDEQIHRQVAAKVSASLLEYFPPEQQTTTNFWIIVDDLLHFFNTGQHQG